MTASELATLAEAAGCTVEAMEGDYRRPLRSGRGAGRRPGALGIVGVVSGSSDQIRLLLVEDVARWRSTSVACSTPRRSQAARCRHRRRKVLEFVRERQPDIVMVDALLQGKVRGLRSPRACARRACDLPIIVLTVPQNPSSGPEMGIDAVLAMPFSGFDFMNSCSRSRPRRRPRSPKAIARLLGLRPQGRRGQDDHRLQPRRRHGQPATRGRAGRRQPPVRRPALAAAGARRAPSMLELPTDRISESDLSDVLWRDPSGIDILLAPPRVEMPEMVTVRDVDKILSSCAASTTSSSSTPRRRRRDGPGVPRCQRHGHRGRDRRLDDDRQHACHGRDLPGHRLPADKVRYVLNRADSPGGIEPAALSEQLGREPDSR